MWMPLLLTIFSIESHAHLNVFMSQVEVMKLLGINAELFYVREGVVNTYALNFVVKIPAQISDIQFSWQSLTKKPLPYVLAVKYDGEGALLPPQMNISSTGVIPTSVQTFRIVLACTGLKSAEIEVKVQLNVTSNSRLRNDTSLNFRRNKICLRGIKSPFAKDSVRLNHDTLETTSGSLYIAIACATAMIVILAITTSAVCIKNKKIRSQETHAELNRVSAETSISYMSAVYDSNQHVFVRLGSAMRRTPSAGSGSYATIASIHKSPPSPSPYATSDDIRVSYYASSQIMLLSQMALQDPRLVDPTERIRALTVTHLKIHFEELIQEGTFGQIYRGTFRNEKVFIKTVSEAASRRQISLFLAEGTIMFEMSHKNILPILAVNTENPKQPLLVYPFAQKGNLKRFLVKCRQRQDEQYPLSTQNLVDMAIQILLGMMYLHSQFVCYKDLATRNCVINEKLQVKITDNCLSRDLFPNDYSCLGDNENRPVKWMALESLLHKQFTGASDVWSFGVVLWELTTLAQQPYLEIDPFEICTYLRNGYRLSQPIGCPDELFSVMACCWLTNPMERPTFAQLLAYLQDFFTALSRFI